MVENLRIITSYGNGGCIIATYNKVTPEEKENIEALKPFAKQGKIVTLLSPIKKTGIRTADALIDEEKWEVKTNYTATKSAIDNALRSCKRQALNLVLHICSDITFEVIIEGIMGRLHRTDIEKIVLVKDGQIIQILHRNDILK